MLIRRPNPETPSPFPSTHFTAPSGAAHSHPTRNRDQEGQTHASPSACVRTGSTVQHLRVERQPHLPLQARLRSAVSLSRVPCPRLARIQPTCALNQPTCALPSPPALPQPACVLPQFTGFPPPSSSRWSNPLSPCLSPAASGALITIPAAPLPAQPAPVLS